MRYKNLKRGDQFTLPIDADGYEPVYHIIDKRKQIIYGGNVRGKIRTTAKDEHLKPETPVILLGRIRLNKNITEIERAAITMLYNQMKTGDIYHPVLLAWVKAIGTNKNEMRKIWDFAWENRAKLKPECETIGYKFPESRFDRKNDIAKMIINKCPLGMRNKNNEETKKYRVFGRNDAAALHLALSIVEYREMGRPDGEHTETIMGIGAPLQSITTSLAAKVVEYSQQIQSS